MSDFIVDIIDLNEKVDYSVFVTLFCSYLLTLWLVVSSWVGVDAWKRYENKSLAFLFFLMTFFLNFPMLIFYFIVRPENRFEDYDEWEAGGVNVPIVNFVGKEGVDMVLQLKINPAKIIPDENDMRVDVSWESTKDNMKLTTKPEKKPAYGSGGESRSGNIYSPRGNRKVTNIFSKWRGQAKKSMKKIKEVSADYAERRKPKVDKSEVEKKNEKKDGKKKEIKKGKSKKKEKSKKNKKSKKAKKSKQKKSKKQ